MSTLRVATVQDLSSANPSTPEQIAQGRAKAWIRFNGTGTPAITDDYFCSSISDNGTGDFTINFDSALSNANYMIAGASDNGTSGAAMPPMIRNATVPTTTSVRVIFANGSGTAIDSAYNCVVVFGD
jgi:hypothetical protein